MTRLTLIVILGLALPAVVNAADGGDMDPPAGCGGCAQVNPVERRVDYCTHDREGQVVCQGEYPTHGEP